MIDERDLLNFFARKIYAFRCEKNLSQNDLAKELNCGQHMISAWEAGKNLISTKYLCKLCLAFGISLAYFDMPENNAEESVDYSAENKRYREKNRDFVTREDLEELKKQWENKYDVLLGILESVIKKD